MQVSRAFNAESALFDDDNIVSYGGLIPVMALAQQTCLSDRVYAPSTIGTSLREFTFGHARQLESSATCTFDRTDEPGGVATRS